jgi:hypothetical protein
VSDDRNPYITEDGQPKLKASVVAFVDILGYQEIIREAHRMGTAQQLLIRLHEGLSEASRYMNELDENGEPYISKASWPYKARFKIRTFTDNIVIGYPIRDDAESELAAAFSKLADFQLIMANHGFFVRGAIAIGDLYIDDLTVFGQGLIDSYDGESKHARDPRVVLTKSAKEAVMQHVGYYSVSSHSPHAWYLYKDADGQFFLNYLSSILIAEEEHGPFFEMLEKHKTVIEAKLQEYRDRPAYWAKYAWSAGYHNFFCEQHRYFTDEHKIDLSQFQMQPSRIV